MAAVKDIYMDIMEVLETNDRYFHDGGVLQTGIANWDDCKYIYASYWEIEDHFKMATGYSPIDKEEKIFWEIDDNNRAVALPEITEIIIHLMFKTALKHRCD
jgi:hypothetical protein